MEVLVRLLPPIFLLQFGWSYYRTCWRKGYKLDLWHLGVLQLMVVLVLMQPFARSGLNALAIGPYNTRRMQPFVTPAALISGLGYLFVLVGGGVWRVRLGMGLRKTASAILNNFVRLSLLLLQARRLLLVMSLLTIALIGATLLVYFRVSGFGFNLVGIGIAYPALRPVIQLAGFLGVLTSSSALQRYIVYRERSMLIIAIVIFLLLLFFGSRTFALAGGINVVLVYLVLLRKRLRLSVLLVSILTLLLVTSLMNALRNSRHDYAGSLLHFGAYLAYGNSFSDLRDMAVILSVWNGQYFFGATYLAGLLSFVPQVLLPFRAKYAMGVVTATMAGFSPREHPGLRVGTFGEAYLNFGLLGVVLLGLALGASLRLMDLRVKQELREHNRPTLLTYSYFSVTLVASFLASSVVGASIYSTLLFLGLCWALVRVSRFIGLPLG